MIDKGVSYSYEIGKIGIDGNIEFDYDKLANAIIKANLEVNNEEKKQQQKKEDDLLSKRKEILGERDFSYIKHKSWREFRTFLNHLKVMWKMLTMSRKEAEYFSTVNSLTKMLTSFLLFLIELALYVLAISLFYFSVSSGWLFTDGILISLFMIVFARMIRIARLEIERIDDKNYLMNISMMVIALLTLVITVAGLFISSSNTGG